MTAPTIPQFKLHHRLALALEDSDATVDEMAAVLGVSRTTVYNYMSGARTPKLGMVKLWALRTQVPWQWLASGEQPQEGDRLSTMW